MQTACQVCMNCWYYCTNKLENHYYTDYQPTIIHDRHDHTTPSDSLQPDRLHVNVQPLSTVSLTTVDLGVLACMDKIPEAPKYIHTQLLSVCLRGS